MAAPGIRVVAVIASTLAVTTLGAATREGPSQPSDVLQKFLSCPDPAPSAYRALRHLDAENAHFGSKAWMDVWTEVDAPGGFRYQIAAEGGSEYIRSRIFRETLETERRMWASGAPQRAAVTTDNYVFEGQHSDSDGLESLAVRPRRKDVLLVEGRIFLKPDDGDLVRIEGQLSKTPSFWTRRVQVTRWFQRFEGVRLPVALETIASLRIAGQSSFRMQYEYESVNGQRVGTPQPRASEHNH
jgi:hypothetical protein